MLHSWPYPSLRWPFQEEQRKKSQQLECNGTISAHRNLRLTGSSDSPASASRTRFHPVGQAGLELLTPGDPPASVSQSAGITGVSHRAQPFFFKRQFCHPGWSVVM
ncbi:hypothetical protein AAY473_022142 [Plecturocebus cupreus]